VQDSSTRYIFSHHASVFSPPVSLSHPLSGTCTTHQPLQIPQSTPLPSWSSSSCPSLTTSPVSILLQHPFLGAQLTAPQDYVAETTINAVDTALGYQSTAWNRASTGSRRVPFNRFVSDVIRRASVKMPVILTTLVYVTRAKSHLHIETEDWACERVFLGALMVASKVCPPVSPRTPPQC